MIAVVTLVVRLQVHVDTDTGEITRTTVEVPVCADLAEIHDIEVGDEDGREVSPEIAARAIALADSLEWPTVEVLS